MRVNPGEVIFFEDREYRHCKDEDNDVAYDTWVLKSGGNLINFEKDGFKVTIVTSKFPHGLFGYGYSGTALKDFKQCYCHGIVGRITFETEFEALISAINEILKTQLSSCYYRDFIRKEMSDFANPKSLFNN